MGSSIVVLIETPDWRQAEPAAREAARQGTERIATQFRRSGWRVVRLGRKQSVGDAWIQAGFAAYDEPFKVGGVA
jgi:hypothetical protein